MKKLLTATMIFAALSFIGCSKNKSSSDTQQPAPETSAPAADAKPAGSAEPDDVFDDKMPGEPARVFEGESVKLSDNGPEFRITANEDDGKISILRTDIPDQTAIESDLQGEIFVEDFNFDGFKDIAFVSLVADFNLHTVLIWNDKTKRFDKSEFSSLDPIHLDSKNKFITVKTLAYFTPDSPEACIMKFVFDSTKPVQKTWRSAPKADAPRVTVMKKDMYDAVGPIDSLTFEFRNDGNDVKGYILDCKSADPVVHIPDATTKDMIQKDVNGDGLNDLQFHAKSDPSKLHDVIWTKDLSVFYYGPDDADAEAE